MNSRYVLWFEMYHDYRDLLYPAGVMTVSLADRSESTVKIKVPLKNGCALEYKRCVVSYRPPELLCVYCLSTHFAGNGVYIIVRSGTCAGRGL